MPEGGVKLKNLTGYTTYMISVAAFNAAGDGPRSPPTRGRTQQAGTSFTVNECSNIDDMEKQNILHHEHNVLYTSVHGTLVVSLQKNKPTETACGLQWCHENIVEEAGVD